ncbi:hypothetical protein LSAT2_017538, partial [Lamellibrachia satsuma]
MSGRRHQAITIAPPRTPLVLGARTRCLASEWWPLKATTRAVTVAIRVRVPMTRVVTVAIRVRVPMNRVVTVAIRVRVPMTRVVTVAIRVRVPMTRAIRI